MTPWIVLAVGIAMSFGLYANSIRMRDRELAAANQRTISDTRRDIRGLVGASAIQARDAAKIAFVGDTVDEAALRAFVDERRLAIHTSGSTGIAALVPRGDDAFAYAYVESSGLSVSGESSSGALGVDEAAIEATRTSDELRLTNIFQGTGEATGGTRPEILAAMSGARTASGEFQGWTATLMNPDVLATEVIERVGRLHGLSISEAGTRGARFVNATDAFGATQPHDLVSRATTLSVLGQRLRLDMRMTLATESPKLTAARDLLLGFAIFVSFLLFAIAHLGRRNERRAAVMVREATASLAESEERFRVLVNEQTDVILVIDHGIRIRWANPTATAVLGYPLDEFIGREGLDLVHPDDRARAVESFAELLDPTNDGEPLEIRAIHADGHFVPMEVMGTDLSDQPSVGGIVVNLRDLTERRAVEAELAEAQLRFQVAFEHAPIGISMSSADGTIIRVNTAFAEMLGRTPEQLAGLSIPDISHPDDTFSHLERLRELAKGTLTRYQHEKRYYHADGHIVWASVSAAPVPDASGGVRYVISQIEDITERKAIAERIAHQAIHDPMTGLPNRAVFLDRLRVALDAAARKGTRVGVIFCDLDHFKWINDTHGHATGDQVLAAVGDRLRSALRPSDSVARFGGDEFTILCGDLVEERTLLAVADRIHEVIADPFPLPGEAAYISSSVGAAISGPGCDTPEDLLRAADTAMYRAKAAGRSCTVVYDANDTAQSTITSLRTGNALHLALERGEFRVFYQPFVQVATGDVIGVEALVRWEHPERGLVEPNDFVPLAEETGLIVPIGRWVLEEACRQAVLWQQSMPPGHPGFSVSVNLSPRQLSEPSLANDVAAIIASSGIEPDTLWLEITETTLMHDAESAVSALRALRAQGVHLAVDDFGTGYSSLQYLKRFPVEALKVDRSFVDGLGREPEDSAIVGAVISLAHSLNMVCVAEGVESTSQLRELQRLDCNIGQGFLFGKPQTVEQLAPFPTSAVATVAAVSTLRPA
jgi:diguanylate cyclase (GGDEF)-like protein/PAS domain S-box-containing protein